MELEPIYSLGVAYDEHYRYWTGRNGGNGGNGGNDPTSAYRRFVKDGLIDSVDPRIDRLRDWVYGGEDFLRRVFSMAEGDDPVLHRRRVRRANPVSVDSIFEATASQYALSADEYVGFRSGAAGRDMVALTPLPCVKLGKIIPPRMNSWLVSMT